MARSTTPTYRLELHDGRRAYSTPIPWEGRATPARLEAWIRGYGKSLERGGVNDHLSKALGYIPYPSSATLIRQKTGEVVATWQVAPCEVW